MAMNPTWRCHMRCTLSALRLAQSSGPSRRPPPQGVRSQGRPVLPKVSSKVRRQEDNRLAESARQHDEALWKIAERSGGALYHGTVLDSQASTSSRNLGDVQPGDFVEVQAIRTYEGIVIPFAQLDTWHSSVDRIAVVLVSGEVKFLSQNDALINFPSVVDSNLVNRAKIVLQQPEDGESHLQTSLSTGEIHEDYDRDRFEARAQICGILRSLLRQTQEQKWKLSPLFERRFLSPTDGVSDTPQGLVTIVDVAALLLSDQGMSVEQVKLLSSSPAVLYATHQLLISAPDIFRLDTISHRSTLTFSIQSASHRRVLYAVQGMVHASLEGLKHPEEHTDDPIRRFSEKVKRAIQDRKEITHGVQDSGLPKIVHEKKMAPIAWTDDDKDILLFLRASLGLRRVFRTEAAGELVLYILDQCGYRLEIVPDTIDTEPGPNVEMAATQKALIARMLRDLGLLSPWENLVTMENEFCETIEPGLPVIERLQMEEDSFMRQDHHEPVYVIDDPGADELDDGLSIERTSDPNQSWLHVHVADPSAAVRPDDQVALSASKRFTSFYLPDRKYAMLPSELTDATGLRPETGKNVARRAMTFSAKVDHTTGCVTDINMGLSWLDDIRILTYDAASEIMKRDTSDHDRQTVDLKTIFDITLALQKRRRDVRGAIDITLLRHAYSIDPLPLLPSSIRQSSVPPFESHVYSGFPAIGVHEGVAEAQGFSVKVSHSRGAVAEAAILAGQVAARWMHERGVPTLYRSQLPPEDKVKTAELLAARDSSGIVSWRDAAKMGLQLQPASLSHMPAQHFSMGIRTPSAFQASRAGVAGDDLIADAGYVRATSPLRRYLDLLVHWQIRHALRLQHPSRNAGSPAGFPFRNEDLIASVPRFLRMQAWSRNVDRATQRFWFTLKLYRTLLARKIAAGLTDNTEGLTALQDSLQDEVASAILDSEHDAVIAVPTIRVMPNMEARVMVDLTHYAVSALCVWQSFRDASRPTVLPQLGQRLRVRVVDIAWSGSVHTITVRRVDE